LCTWSLNAMDPAHRPRGTFHHTTNRLLETQEDSYTWTRLEFRARPADPFKKIRKAPKDAILTSGDSTNADYTAIPAPDSTERSAILTIESAPALCLGDRAVFWPEDGVEFEVYRDGELAGVVAGEEYVELVATDLGLGFHTLELVGRDEEIGLIRGQVPFSIIHPLAFDPMPVVEIELGLENNGHIVELSPRQANGVIHEAA
jgi:hypothetical protein